jgi:predicted outer membrane lipoprotein
MKTFLMFLLFMFLAIVAIVIGVIIGDYGSWYFAWLVGTGMMVLVAAAGGAWMDTQEDEAQADLNTKALH